MARLYADEQFTRKVVELLRDLGHNVLTVQEAGNASLPDENVLEFAINQNRAILTLDRRDFKRLHQQKPNHFGIIACTDDEDRERMAIRISNAISLVENLTGKLIQVYKTPL
jgi:predicted nuclease of predicted toxin-antitoxin system